MSDRQYRQLGEVKGLADDTDDGIATLRLLTAHTGHPQRGNSSQRSISGSRPSNLGLRPLVFPRYRAFRHIFRFGIFIEVGVK